MVGWLRKRVQGVRRSPVVMCLPLLWEASPFVFCALAALLVFSAVTSAGMLVVSGLVVGAIPAAVRSGLDSPAGHRLYVLLALTAGFTVITTLQSLGQVLLQTAWTSRFRRVVQRRAMRATMRRPGIAHLEDPAYIDELALAMATPGSSPFEVPRALMWVVAMYLESFGATLILFRFHWWAPLVLVAALMTSQRWLSRELDLLFQFWSANTTGHRKASYFRDLTLTPPAAKEIRVFGLAPWVVGRFSSQWGATMANVWKERRALRWQMLRQAAVQGLGYGIVYLAIAHDGISGAISLGGVAVFVQACNGMWGFTGEGLYMLRNSANSIPHLVGLDDLPSAKAAQLPGTRTDTADRPTSEIRFSDVRFAYPGTDQPIFDGLDLHIRRGESLAIVGQNGAGKTTLIKLLSRLYDADHGTITVDGIDLRDIEPAAWRDRVSVIFQDFVQYPMSARENVAMGDLANRSDEAVRRAIDRAGAADLVDQLGDGWDTLLTKQLKGGTDLSGGQWQKIALARALLAAQRGGILVLDEPTANLDVRAEVELFDRFLELTEGTTTVLISHRFSTVRHADRIVVLEAGRVVEEGSHEELLGAGGRYARMFLLQAERFGAGEATHA
jgi:ATP-binding cassette subfamily B protein